MAPTKGRVARPERRWDCRRGTPVCQVLLAVTHNCKNNAVMEITVATTCLVRQSQARAAVTGFNTIQVTAETIFPANLNLTTTKRNKIKARFRCILCCPDSKQISSIPRIQRWCWHTSSQLNILPKFSINHKSGVVSVNKNNGTVWDTIILISSLENPTFWYGQDLCMLWTFYILRL